MNSDYPVYFNTLSDYALQFDNPPPASVDVVVIGGGVIGVCTAYQLARDGVSVALCEKGLIAGEQSSRNWGWIRQLGRDDFELPIMMESLQMWQGLSREIGEDVGFRQHGIIYLASSAEKLAARESWMPVARSHQLDVRMINRHEVARQIDGTSDRWCGGLYCPGDGRAEPWVAVPAIARAAARHGATISEHCAVRGIEQQGGRLSAVVTEHGRIQCSAVVLATGAWSSLFATGLGVYLPQLSVRSTVVSTTPVHTVYEGNAADEEIAFRRREDGGYTLALSDLTEHLIGPDSIRYLRPFLPVLADDWRSFRFGVARMDFPDGWRTRRRWSAAEQTPFERNRILNPPPRAAAVKALIRRFRARFPQLSNVAVAHSWAGMIDTMPDVVPVIDQVTAIPGLFISTGFSGHGFGIGPAAGKVVSELVQGKPVSHDLQRFRLSRFTDGSQLTPGPVL